MIRLLAGFVAALALAPSGAVAQGVPAAYRGLDGAGGETQALGRRVDLSIGRSLVIDLPRDAKEVFVANPAVANAIVRSSRKVFLIGVANGATSVFVMDGEGRQIASLEVNVGRDLSILRQTLRSVLPSAKIDIRPAGDSILMTGSVASAGDAQQAADIASAFVGQSSGGAAGGGGGGGAAASGGGTAGSTGATGAISFSGGVINVLTIRGRDQVMLKVTVAEVARNVLKQFGVNVGGNWNVVETAASAGAAVAKANPASNLVGFATGAIGALNGATGASISGQYGNRDFNVGGTLSAFERAGVLRTLAEPNLTAISGESAKFVVGGEIPIPSTCPVTTTGCPPIFKPFGVLLNFTPVVLSEGRISIRVGTEVSEIDTSVTVSGVPGFRLRRTETTVELPSGGMMMVAGLIQQTGRNVISGLPGLLNVPVLGTLFRSRDYQRQETELVIMVTPYVVKPIEPSQGVRPDDGFVDAQDTQAVLFGRLNKIYGVAGNPGTAAKPRGSFGFITD